MASLSNSFLLSEDSRSAILTITNLFYLLVDIGAKVRSFKKNHHNHKFTTNDSYVRQQLFFIRYLRGSRIST